MDVSQLPSCFFPLCFLLVLTRTVDFIGRTKKKKTRNDENHKSNHPSQRILVGCVAFLALTGYTYSTTRRHMISSFPAVEQHRSSVFLPDPNLDPKRHSENASILLEEQQQQKSNENDAEQQQQQQQQQQDDGYILITGASKGIGRALAIELARRYGRTKRFLVTSRNPSSLKDGGIAHDLETFYQADVTIIPESIDLSQPGDAQRLFDITSKQMGVYVDVLILCAGIGSRGDHVTFSSSTSTSTDTTQAISNMITLNVQSSMVLAALYGSEMQQHQQQQPTTTTTNNKGGGRILFISSITGAVPGMPSGAMYAATKSFLRSFAWGLAGELESSGIGVTCAMPGATSDTSFAETSGMEDSAVWNYPLMVSYSEAVARHTIDALVRGDVEVFPGRLLDGLTMRLVAPLLPPSFVTWGFGFSWRPWPFASFPPGWKKIKIKEGNNRNDDGQEL